MTWRLPDWLLRGLIYPLVALLARSWRIRVIDREIYSGARNTGRPVIVILWHEMMLPLLWVHRGEGVATVISENHDGRTLAGFASRLGYAPIGGSSSRGAFRAARGALSALHAGGTVAITPDGPRGPRRQAKPGALRVAARSGAVIVLAVAAAERARRLRSWDRFLVPRPFSRVRVGYREYHPGTGTPGQECQRLASMLNHLEQELAWPDGDRPTD